MKIEVEAPEQEDVEERVMTENRTCVVTKVEKK